MHYYYYLFRLFSKKKEPQHTHSDTANYGHYFGRSLTEKVNFVVHYLRNVVDSHVDFRRCRLSLASWIEIAR